MLNSCSIKIVFQEWGTGERKTGNERSAVRPIKIQNGGQEKGERDL